MKKSHRVSLSILFSILNTLLACSTLEPSSSRKNLDEIKTFRQPFEFQSPLNGADQIYALLQKNNLSKSDRKFITAQLKEILDSQESLGKEMNSTGELILKPGHSYEFDLESFCVDSGLEQPVVDDGAYIGEMEKSYSSWLPIILDGYKDKNITQEDVQVLVWALTSGAKFDELSSRNQGILKKVFPDAPIRFGSSILSEKFKEILEENLPTEAIAAKERFSYFKELLRESDRSYQEIEAELSPDAKRKDPILVGWTKTSDGYFIKLTSKGYTGTNVKIYTPENIETEVSFKPLSHLAIPKKGQRIALSNVVIDKYLRNYADRGAYYLTGMKLNDREKDLVVKYPMDAAYLTAVSGFVPRKHFSEEEHINNKADAFRHYYWAGLMGRELGEEKGKQFLDAHESFPENPTKEKKMDLHNNSEGLKFSKNYEGENFEEDLEKFGLEKIKLRELKWLE